jgi:hypothetical protein
MATHTTAEDKKAYTSGQTVDYFKNIHDGLLAVGLTKTADTGQLDLSSAGPTVTLSSANHDYGYSIFQFTDSYQSTYPIFVKVRYTNDSMASTTQRVILRVEVGEGTDGAGNLTGKTNTRVQTDSQSTTTNAGTFSTNNICFYDGTLVLTTAVIATSGIIPGNQYRFVAIGRRKDMSGSYTKGSYKVMNQGSSTTPSITTTTDESHITEYRTTLGVVSFTGGNNSTLAPYHWSSENSSAAYDNSLPVLPMYTLTPVPEYIPNVISVDTGVGYNNSFTSDFDGTKNFLTTDGRIPSLGFLTRIAHIWE